MLDSRDGDWFFLQSGMRLEDATLRAASNGAPAIEAYLRKRRQQLVRDMSHVVAQNADPSRYVQAIAAFEAASMLLESLPDTPVTSSAFGTPHGVITKTAP